MTVDGKDIEVGLIEIRFIGSADYEGRTMREGSAKKNSYGRSRNMEGQRSNDGDESETSERFGVPDCSLRSGDLDNEKHERRKIDAFEFNKI